MTRHRLIRKEFMEAAIREARKNLKSLKGGPFGACIVKGDEILAVARNTVLTGDATAHAEVNAIRKACRKIGSPDLSGCIIYSTTEPCPMCFSAAHWARIGVIVSGTNIGDARKAGFRELDISNEELKAHGKSPIRLVKDFMRTECLALLKNWMAAPGARTY